MTKTKEYGTYDQGSNKGTGIGKEKAKSVISFAHHLSRYDLI
jgi:hypothetical protein